MIELIQLIPTVTTLALVIFCIFKIRQYKRTLDIIKDTTYSIHNKATHNETKMYDIHYFVSNQNREYVDMKERERLERGKNDK